MRRTALACAMALLSAMPVVKAGDLTPPAAPTDPLSARYTLGDVYARLQNGTVKAKRPGAFLEPEAGPTVPTMWSTDDIMGIAPAVDDANGAAAADVAAGKTFWGLRTSGGVWGLQTGTGSLSSYPAPVGKTGQTQCYDPTNVLTTCPGTPAGQDGALQKGVAWPNPRFTDNIGNGTVTDNLTGLIWLKDANCATISSATWSVAMANAAALANGACGLTDLSTAGQWRVPNVKEFQSLIDFAFVAPSLSNSAGTGQWTAGNPFTNVVSDYYWSSSTIVDNPALAWIVNLYYGNVAGIGKANTYYFWPVRGGQ